MALTVLHFLHIFAGVSWAGGVLLMAMVIYPLLAKMPPDEAAALLTRLSRPLNPFLGGMGGLVMMLGLARAWFSGNWLSRVWEFADWGVFISSYFLATLAAFLLTGYFMARDRQIREQFLALSENQADYPRKAAALARLARLQALAVLAAILALMVGMGLGWL